MNNPHFRRIAEATQAGRQALRDWADGLDENPYPAGIQHRVYARTMAALHEEAEMEQTA